MVMPRLSLEKFAGLAPQMSSEQRRAASVAGVAHALHDGYTDLIYIMLPLWQAEFGFMRRSGSSAARSSAPWLLCKFPQATCPSDSEQRSCWRLAPRLPVSAIVWRV
jgi:hypothetical protein